jgi:hypothetical protein
MNLEEIDKMMRHLPSQREWYAQRSVAQEALGCLGFLLIVAIILLL